MNWLDQKKRASILPFLFLHWFAVGLLGTISYAGEPIDMTFTSTLDGTEQRYVMIMPEGFDRTKSYDVLIALHGHGSDRWQLVRCTGRMSGRKGVCDSREDDFCFA